MNGGRLVQHCTGHATGYSHSITNGHMKYQITSTHHQMAYPYSIAAENYDILYWADGRKSDRYEGDQIDEGQISVEPEITLYHIPGKPKCLGVQGHPEMIPESPVAEMINELIDSYVNK